MIIISIKAFMKLPDTEKFILLRKVTQGEAQIIDAEQISLEELERAV